MKLNARQLYATIEKLARIINVTPPVAIVTLEASLGKALSYAQRPQLRRVFALLRDAWDANNGYIVADATQLMVRVQEELEELGRMQDEA